MSQKLHDTAPPEHRILFRENITFDLEHRPPAQGGWLLSSDKQAMLLIERYSLHGFFESQRIKFDVEHSLDVWNETMRLLQALGRHCDARFPDMTIKTGEQCYQAFGQCALIYLSQITWMGPVATFTPIVPGDTPADAQKNADGQVPDQAPSDYEGFDIVLIPNSTACAAATCIIAALDEVLDLEWKQGTDANLAFALMAQAHRHASEQQYEARQCAEQVDGESK